jgi:predicted permease
MIENFRRLIQSVNRDPWMAILHVGLLSVVVALLSLAFNVFDVYFLRPAAVRFPERLVRPTFEIPNVGIRSYFSLPAIEAMANQPQVEGATGFIELFGLTVKDKAGIAAVRAEAVAANYYSLLGVRMVAGRGLTKEEAERTAEIPLVLSHSYWRQRYASDPAVVGERVTIRNQPARIVGVTERAFNGFTLDTGADVRFPVWAAALLYPGDAVDFGPHTVSLDTLILLRPGVAPESVQDALVAAAIAGEEEAARQRGENAVAPGEARRQSTYALAPAAVGQSWFRDRNGQALSAFLGAAAVLFILVTANLAGLWLARAVRREQEMSVRLALGAGRSRLIRELFAEALILGTASAAVAAGLTMELAPLLPVLLPPMREFGSIAVRPVAADFTASPFVLAVGVAACLLATLILALAPSLALLRLRPMDALRRLRIAHGWKGQRGFLVAQVALLTALVVGALLSAYTLRSLSAMDLGFDYGHVAVFDIHPEAVGYSGRQSEQLSRELRARVEELAGVEGVAFGSGLLEGIGMVATWYPTGKTITRSERMNTSMLNISPGFLQVIGQRVLDGREFQESDLALAARRPILVNQAYVERFFAGRNPIGRTIGSPDVGKPAGDEMEVVGVVENAQMRTLRHARPPIVYTLWAPGQTKDGVPDPGFALKMYVRTGGDADGLLEPVRRAVSELAPEVPVTAASTLREQREISLRTDQLVAGLGMGFTVLAFAIAGLGIFSMLSLMVLARTKEIGVRMALGAKSANVMGLVLWQVLWIAGSGLALGLAAAAIWFPRADDLFRGVTGRDPLVLATGAALTLGMALLAALIPARRAVRLQPVTALREE